MNERECCLAFSLFSGIGPIKFKKLLAKFGSAKAAWKASSFLLVKVLGNKLTIRFGEFRNVFSVEQNLKQMEENNVWYLTLDDREYPELLKKIKNPPFVLYGKGQVPDDTWFSRSIAVVGTRKTTYYGREVTKFLAEDLTAAGLTIVSGLAIGVDAVAHMICIENGGKTIAVLGCGVDCCYPKENIGIYNSIIKNKGCIVSEYPLGQSPTKGSFPARNRIIAGLSNGVVVTEGAEDSGSLITADFAIQFGRKVFAVPGPITSSMSKGPYKLISRGAKLVTSAGDILKELKIKNEKLKIKIQKSKVKDATKDELEILNLLQNEPLHFDELAKRTKFDSSKIGSLLSLMEIKGLVRCLDNGAFFPSISIDK